MTTSSADSPQALTQVRIHLGEPTFFSGDARFLDQPQHGICLWAVNWLPLPAQMAQNIRGAQSVTLQRSEMFSSADGRPGAESKWATGRATQQSTRSCLNFHLDQVVLRRGEISP